MLLEAVYVTISIIGIGAAVYATRVCILIRQIRRRRQRIRQGGTAGSSELAWLRACKLLVVLGSGGHTAEMLTLVQDALRGREAATQVVYVTGATDEHSAKKAASMHATSDELGVRRATTSFIRIPRAREVGQSWTSSVVSTVRTAFAGLCVVASERPDVVVCNGPGTCVVVAVCALLIRACGNWKRGRVVYVESFARVTTLSLSGRIVYGFADRFLVQWESLGEFEMAEFYGRLC